MSCCGKQRDTISRSTGDTTYDKPTRLSGIHMGDDDQAIRFQYVGRTALTVIGTASGRRYYFDTPGAQIAVDPRDRAYLRQVPNLWDIST